MKIPFLRYVVCVLSVFFNHVCFLVFSCIYGCVKGFMASFGHNIRNLVRGMNGMPDSIL